MAKIKRTKVSVTVSRTVQVQNYTPSTVTVMEEAEVQDGQKASSVKEALYESATDSVQMFMRAEIKKYKAKESK